MSLAEPDHWGLKPHQKTRPEPDIMSQTMDMLTETLKRRTRLDEIAFLMRELTYGEMMHLSAGVCELRGDQEINETSLPGILHAWATKP